MPEGYWLATSSELWFSRGLWYPTREANTLIHIGHCFQAATEECPQNVLSERARPPCGAGRRSDEVWIRIDWDGFGMVIPRSVTVKRSVVRTIVRDLSVSYRLAAESGGKR